LSATMKTLSSGIYYETLPEGPVRISLFRRLKEILDALMSPSDGAQRSLLVSDVLQLLEFLVLSLSANSSGRPKSRQYLDWLTAASGVAAPPMESRRLIIPVRSSRSDWPVSGIWFFFSRLCHSSSRVFRTATLRCSPTLDGD